MNITPLRVLTLPVILIGMLLSMLIVWPVAAQDNQPQSAQLSLVPVTFQDPDTLPVNIELANAENLYGIELELAFDPSQLEVQDRDAAVAGVQLSVGSLLPPGETRLVIFNSADNETGRIKFVATLLNPATPVTVGSTGQSVATIFFNYRDKSQSSDITVTSLKLISVDLTAIPVDEPQPLAINIDTPASVPTPPNPTATETATGGLPEPASIPWWAVGLLIGSMVIAGALVFVIWSGQQDGPPAIRKMPGATFSSGRSSVLLTQRGNEAMSDSDFDMAYEHFSQAVELDPANADAWVGKGLVAQQENEKKICLQRALTLDPENATAQTALKQL